MVKFIVAVLSLIPVLARSRILGKDAPTPAVEETDEIKTALSRKTRMVAAVHSVLNNLKSECEKQKHQLAEHGNSSADALADELPELEHALRIKRQSVEQLAKRMKALKSSFQKTEPRVDNHNTNNVHVVAFKRAYDNLDLASAVVDDAVSEQPFLGQKRKMKDALSRKEQELSDLHERLHLLKVACDEVSKGVEAINDVEAPSAARAQRLKTEIWSTKKHAEHLQENLEAAKEKLDEKRTLKGALARKNHEVVDIQTTLSSLKTTCEAKKSELEFEQNKSDSRGGMNATMNEVRALKATLDSIRQSIRDLSSRLRELNQSFQEPEPRVEDHQEGIVPIVNFKRAYNNIDLASIEEEVDDGVDDHRLSELRDLKDALARKNHILSDLHERFRLMKLTCDAVSQEIENTHDAQRHYILEKQKLGDEIWKDRKVSKHLQKTFDQLKDVRDVSDQ